MKLIEMDKFMLWLIGIFSQWNPDKAIAAVWANELPDITAEQAIQAVRVVQQGNPSPFPPGVFEIKSKLKGCCNPRNEAKIIFNALWEGAGTGQVRADVEQLVNSPRAQEALRLVGGGYGQALTAEKAWHEKRFVEIYEGLNEMEALHDQNYPRLLEPDRRMASQGLGIFRAGIKNLEESADRNARCSVDSDVKRLEAKES